MPCSWRRSDSRRVLGARWPSGAPNRPRPGRTLRLMDIYKAHGTGNDFVVLPDPEGRLDLSAETVVALCDRRFGIGADGVLRLAPFDDGHVFMDYRNGGDGAPVEMCGNGVRLSLIHISEPTRPY